MNWRVLCDFDGTIALEDVTDSILERFALDGWQDVETEWKNGQIGSRECMAKQVALIRALAHAPSHAARLPFRAGIGDY